MNPLIQSANLSFLNVVIGSPQVILSRKLVEFSILGWDNFPRTLLLFFANIKSSHRGYFQTLACNAREFSNTVMNSNLRYMAWDNPPGKEPRNPRVSDVKKMLGSGAAFAGNFAPNDHEVLDLIDSVVLHRRKGMISPGGWCVGRRDRGRDPCQHWGDTNILRPGHAAERFEKLLLRVMANSTLRSNQCRWFLGMMMNSCRIKFVNHVVYLIFRSTSPQACNSLWQPWEDLISILSKHLKNATSTMYHNSSLWVHYYVDSHSSTSLSLLFYFILFYFFWYI